MAIIGPNSPRSIRARELAEIKAERERQASASQVAIGGLLGGQEGPFRADLQDPETGRSLPLAKQTLTDQAATLARASQVPALAGRVQEEVFGPDAGAQSQIDITRARIDDIGIDNMRELDRINRESQAKRVTGRKDFQSMVQGNEMIGLALNGLTRLNQLQATLFAPGAGALEKANAAVLFSQIAEKGLAVRGDDRVAVVQGAEPGWQFYANQVNQFLGEKISMEEAQTNIMRAARNMVKPLLAGGNDALNFFTDLETDTPGIKAGDTARLLGFTPEMLAVMQDLSIEEF